MSSSSNFKMTPEEETRLAEAIKNPEFMQLLSEYAKEISDPKTREENEEYFRQLEREGQMPSNAQIVVPKPEFCVKTRIVDKNKSSQKKLFINICSSDKVSKPEKMRVEGRNGDQWRVPLSLGKVRDGKDGKDESCQICDIVFHSETTQRAADDDHFKQFLINLAVDWIEEKYEMKVKKNSVKILKRKTFGEPEMQTIRVEEKPLIEEVSHEDKEPKNPLPPKKREPVTPKHEIVYRGEFDMSQYLMSRKEYSKRWPKALHVRIYLPEADSTAGLILNTTVDKVELTDSMSRYELHLSLPYPIVPDDGSAKFDKTKKILLLKLPVREPTAEEIREEIEKMNNLEHDESGVQNDEECHPGIVEVQEEEQSVKEKEREKQEEVERKRKEREERERKESEEREKKAREEREKKAREEREKKAREEREKKAREEREKKAREEREKKAREEREKKAREEREKKAREEREKKEGEEREKKAREETERKERAEVDRPILEEGKEEMVTDGNSGVVKEEDNVKEQSGIKKALSDTDDSKLSQKALESVKNQASFEAHGVKFRNTLIFEID